MAEGLPAVDFSLRRERNRTMDGVVVVNKPPGITSHDVVHRLRRLYGTRRIGHTGTLDPLATGVLVACLGQATRVVEYLSAARKEYVAGVVFGLTTDTEDITGHTISETDTEALTEEAVREALTHFRGEILQKPPMVSAVHHEGKRLYELARQGIEVERTARPVHIYRLEMKTFVPGPRARATLCIECSTGTYIRTLAADLGAALDVGGTMESLLRTRTGAFTLEEAHTLEELAACKEAGTLTDSLRSIADALADWPHIVLDSEAIRRIAHGQAIPLSDVTPPRIGGLGGLTPPRIGGPGGLTSPLLLLDAKGSAVGIARIEGAKLTPIKVFVSDEGIE